MVTNAARSVPSLRVSASGAGGGAACAYEETLRAVPEETPIAIVYDGTTNAVMLATPADLEDFALGFSYTEGHIERLSDVQSIEIVEQATGIEARIWLAAPAGQRISTRRRAMTGPTGCGLCGVESLDAAVPVLPPVSRSLKLGSDDVQRAMASLASQQELNLRTRAVHAAGYWSPTQGLIAIREDVGRHNALDKLVGTLVRNSQRTPDGIVVLTSRVSVEMVQKAVRLGAEVIVAVSAPTALAIRTAEAAGVTLIAVARSDGFEVFTHGDRLMLRAATLHSNGAKRHAL
jgi:FdhD protein